MTFEAATKANVTRWFEGPGRHPCAPATPSSSTSPTTGRDPEDKGVQPDHALGGEALAVSELRPLLAVTSDPNVRVVMLMSQCFSGGFATLRVSQVDRPAAAATCAATSHPPPTGWRTPATPRTAARDNVGPLLRLPPGAAAGGRTSPPRKASSWSTTATPGRAAHPPATATSTTCSAAAERGPQRADAVHRRPPPGGVARQGGVGTGYPPPRPRRPGVRRSSARARWPSSRTRRCGCRRSPSSSRTSPPPGRARSATSPTPTSAASSPTPEWRRSTWPIRSSPSSIRRASAVWRPSWYVSSSPGRSGTPRRGSA